MTAARKLTDLPSDVLIRIFELCDKYYSLDIGALCSALLEPARRRYMRDAQCSLEREARRLIKLSRSMAGGKAGVWIQNIRGQVGRERRIQELPGARFTDGRTGVVQIDLSPVRPDTLMELIGSTRATW